MPHNNSSLTTRCRDEHPTPAVLSTVLLGALLLLANPAPNAAQEINAEREFALGYRAYQLARRGTTEPKKWEDVADRMWQAEQGRHEDGEVVRVYARWFEPYLPRFYLGLALYKLGCYEEALHQFEDSMINEVRGKKREKNELESLKQECRRYLDQGEVDDENYCSQWHMPYRKPKNGEATEEEEKDGTRE